MTQTNNSQPWTLTLANVLSGPEPLDMVAGAQDIPNVRLEAKRGIWYGHLGDHADQSTVTPLTMTYVSIGATIKVSGVPYSWGGAGVGWIYMGSGPQYVGTGIPLSGAYIGQLIQVDNAAVPGGRSILRWTGALWSPPAGELIVAVQPSSEASPVALVKPGVTTLVMIAQSVVIPDYMLPNLLEWEITGMMGVQSATTGPCVLGIGISGQLPTAPWTGNYPVSVSTVPQASPNFAGFDPNFILKMQTRRGINFRHSPIQARAYYDYPSQTGTFVSGANRLYAMAVPDSASTIVRLDAMAAYSRGNL